MASIHYDQSTVDIHPQGGYVTKWMVEGQELLYQGSQLKRTGIPILFPYASKPRIDLPQHGFGRNHLWHITQESSALQMTLTDADVPMTDRPYYDHAFVARVSIALSSARTLLYSLSVTNTGTTLLPISPGLHPYWSLPHIHKSKIHIEGIDGFDGHALDWDANPPDTDYAYTKAVTLHMPDRSITIEDISPVAPTIQYITVWSQPVSAIDHDFVCVEPVCGSRDRFITDPIRVSPGDTWEMAVKFELT